MSGLTLLQVSLASDLLDDEQDTDWLVFLAAAVLNRASDIIPLLCFFIAATATCRRRLAFSAVQTF